MRHASIARAPAAAASSARSTRPCGGRSAMLAIRNNTTADNWMSVPCDVSRLLKYKTVGDRPMATMGRNARGSPSQRLSRTAEQVRNSAWSASRTYLAA